MVPSRFAGNFLVSLVLVLAPTSWSAPFDVAIRHGLVIDGTGKLGVRADVGISDGRIVAVGPDLGPAGRDIDATGLVVAPGFIDVHTHAEGILNAPLAANFVRMGVTTVIAGNCGASVPDVAAFMADLARARPVINFATLIGHNQIRGDVMGTSFMRPPTPDELGRMKTMVARAMRDGALGLSTGLIYIPGKYARTEEMIELARVAATNGGIYASHVRDENEGLISSLDEVFRVGREARLPVQISHLKLSGNLIQPQTASTVTNLQELRHGGLATQVEAALSGARAAGLQVTQDHYVYSAVTLAAEQLLPENVIALPREELLQKLGRPSDRQNIVTSMEQQLRQSGRTNFADIAIMVARRLKTVEGLNLVEAARVRRNDDSIASQIEMILDLARVGGVIVTRYDGDEIDLRAILDDTHTMFASDGGAFQGINDSKHPRGQGNSARVLAWCVREKKWLTLEEAVRRMTSLPATTFKLKDRGEIRPGAWADVTVFDPARIQDQATFLNPQSLATGFRAILINGVEVVVSDVPTGERPGRPLRRGE